MQGVDKMSKYNNGKSRNELFKIVELVPYRHHPLLFDAHVRRVLDDTYFAYHIGLHVGLGFVEQVYQDE